MSDADVEEADWEEDLWRAEQDDSAEARMDREAEAAGELPEFDMPDVDDECTQPRTANEDDQLQTEPMDEGSEEPQRQETESGDATAAASAGAMQTPERGARAPTGATDVRDNTAAATDARDVGSGQHLHAPRTATEGESSARSGRRRRMGSAQRMQDQRRSRSRGST